MKEVSGTGAGSIQLTKETGSGRPETYGSGSATLIEGHRTLKEGGGGEEGRVGKKWVGRGGQGLSRATAGRPEGAPVT